ncbi:MAG TPA: ABC transporter ATP-binding protein [Clostridiaceae bacterium]|nr:ABC transporter ATP-binding protein [Clostridiaceae bacterium]
MGQAEQDKLKKKRQNRLLKYTLQAKSTLGQGLFVTLLTVAASLLAPYLVKYLLDNELKEGVSLRVNFIILILVAYFGTMLLASVMRYFSTLLMQKAANKISMQMQLDVFSHVQKLPIEFFDQLPAGQVVSRVTNDTKAVKVLYQVVLSQFLMAGIYALGTYISLFLIDPMLVLIGLIPMPIIFFLFRDFRKKSALFNRIMRRKLSELNGNLNENIQGMEVISSLGKESQIYLEFSTINNQTYEQGRNMTKLYGYSSYSATSALQYLMLAAILFYFGYGHLSGSYWVPIGTLYVFTDYMIALFSQINNAMTRVGDLERSRSAADHIFELLDRETVSSGCESAPVSTGRITFEDVTFAYKDEDVLKDVSFKVKPDQTVAFVGHTGSGKSTILNLLFAFYKPQKGKILFEGVPLESLDCESFRRQMAIVLQDPFLFTGTILSNITLNREDISRADAESALREVGGDLLLDRLEDGIDTKVTEKGQGFSSGERQLISFARALAHNPRILVLDEATSSIDSETEAVIQKAMRRLEQGRTTLIIAHRLSTIKHADQIIVLDRGRIAEQGSHDDLITEDGIYKSMYEAQSQEDLC